MRLLKKLKARRLVIEVRTEHAENTAGSLIAHIVDGAIREAVLAEVLPHVILQPEGHRRGNRPLRFKSVAARFEPVLFAELTFRRHCADDWDAPGFVRILFQRLLFHFIAAFGAYFEWCVEQMPPACRHTKP